MTGHITVLAYHAIGQCSREADKHNLFVDEESFAAQMDYLARRRRVIDLDEVVSNSPSQGPPRVTITFDDGYRNVLERALPILERHGFGATVFVPTAYIGRRNTWIEPTICDVEIMTEDELRSGAKRGLRIESHGHGHIDYSAATAEEARDDLVTSLDRLEQITGRRASHFAYPYGAHSNVGHEAARAAGLRAAYTIDERHGGTFAYERVQITPLDGPRLFALKTSGRYMKLRHSRAGHALYDVIKPVARRVLGRSR